VLNALGNIGDFLGGVGVVVTLIYLAFQIRQNTDQLRADAKQQELSSLDEMNRSLLTWQSKVVESSEVADIWRRGISGREQLQGEERLRFEYHGASIVQIWQANYFRYLETGDANNWGLNETHIRMFLGWPGFREFWDRTKHLYADRFVEQIEQLVDAPPAV
jgi:hypothetical protein